MDTASSRRKRTVTQESGKPSFSATSLCLKLPLSYLRKKPPEGGFFNSLLSVVLDGAGDALLYLHKI